MSTTDSRQENFISEARKQSQALWNAYKWLLSAQKEWTAQDYTDTLKDGEGVNEGILASDVSSVVINTANALEGLMAQGHGTNLTNLLE